MSLASNTSSEFLTFSVSTEEFCIDILKVREIRGFTGVTRLPSAPPDVPGVINLRGVIVPLIDLRIRFGMKDPGYDANTIVIVLALDDRTVGIVVDGVSDVVRLELEDIKEPPGIKFSQECSIVGMATQDERMVMVLDIDATLAGNAKGLEDVVGAAVNSAAFVASA